MARVSAGVVADQLGLSTSRVRQLAVEGVLPSTRTRGGHRRFDLAEVAAAWERHRGGNPSLLPPPAPPRWHRRLDLGGLQEDRVWRELRTAVPQLDEPSAAQRITAYAVTEMINNAIDHSDGRAVDIAVWMDADNLTVVISDDGIGVFARVRRGFDLEDDLAAVAELSKGKRTTDPAAHTGEGIFFTSKAVDLFVLESNGLRWTVDNRREDEAVGISTISSGTTVRLTIGIATERDLVDVFREFSVDHEFVRTRPTIRLFEIGTDFVSRSEAKRLLAGLEQFQQVELDFTDVDSVGQGFVDEVFRVWPRANPGTELTPIGMNDAVRFMVERGLPGRRE